MSQSQARHILTLLNISYEVSGDGKTLTAQIKGSMKADRRFEQVIVFDRQ